MGCFSPPVQSRGNYPPCQLGLRKLNVLDVDLFVLYTMHLKMHILSACGLSQTQSRFPLSFYSYNCHRFIFNYILRAFDLPLKDCIGLKSLFGTWKAIFQWSIICFFLFPSYKLHYTIPVELIYLSEPIRFKTVIWVLGKLNDLNVLDVAFNFKQKYWEEYFWNK